MSLKKALKVCSSIESPTQRDLCKEEMRKCYSQEGATSSCVDFISACAKNRGGKTTLKTNEGSFTAKDLSHCYQLGHLLSGEGYRLEGAKASGQYTPQPSPQPSESVDEDVEAVPADGQQEVVNERPKPSELITCSLRLGNSTTRYRGRQGQCRQLKLIPGKLAQIGRDLVHETSWEGLCSKGVAKKRNGSCKSEKKQKLNDWEQRLRDELKAILADMVKVE